MCSNSTAAPRKPIADQTNCIISIRRHTAVIDTSGVSDTGPLTFHNTADVDEAIAERLWNSAVFGRGIRLDGSDIHEADFLVVPGAMRGMSIDELEKLPGIVAYEWDPHMYPPEEVDDEICSALERLQSEGRLPIPIEHFIGNYLCDPNPDSAFESIDRLSQWGDILLLGDSAFPRLSLPVNRR
ncbi:hypothetical protein VQ042_17620 [Aurantimonas sp. A2-1-M11]|uniref:hypothetical protein n=1 Tax=Aurantimonas sp. A2-1-M11 TaxID=3113712 RepID=UPI002F95D601